MADLVEHLEQVSKGLEFNCKTLKEKQINVEQEMLLKFIKNLSKEDFLLALKQTADQMAGGFHLCPGSNLSSLIRMRITDLWPNDKDLTVLYCKMHGMNRVSAHKLSDLALYPLAGNPKELVYDCCAEVDLTYRPRVTAEELRETV